ncbi:peptidoglycan-binding protein [Kitasatospora purpeofusca]|uniref:peptidoglycan-binding protein n=1 Tax=Kitasatospora purpeofusca TaxID=67352 RepID=UPI00367A93BD
MPDLWMPGAEIHDIGDHAPTDGGPPKGIAHITWDRNATAQKPADWVPFDDLVSYFTSSGGRPTAPHIVWDPFSGRIAQLYPADSRSKSVMDLPGGTRTNRAGAVVIQIEAVFFPFCRKDGTVYPRLVDTPCAGWDRLRAWVASWGVPDVWPMGVPVDFTPHRDEHTWETAAGWYAHGHVPENDHTDPGSWPAFGNTPTTPTEPTNEPPQPARYRTTINGLEYGYGAHGDQVTAVGEALVRAGYGGHYQQGPGPDWTDADTLNYRAYQQGLGYTGADADGVPGETSLRQLLGYLPGTRTVSLAHVVAAARTDPGAEQGHQTYGSEARIVEQALADEGLLDGQWVDGSFGTRTLNAYAAWQRRLGYAGRDADGVPGRSSLVRLGQAHGFAVTD